MNDFVLNIDNKEILNEILHNSIDYLINFSTDNAVTSKSSHKFGFSNIEEFEFARKCIANVYKDCIIKNVTETELISHFAHLNSDLQQCVLDVLNSRRSEVEGFLIVEYNCRKDNLMLSFDWDLKWILGNNNLASLRQQIVTLILNCRSAAGQQNKEIFFEMNSQQLNNLINILEECNNKLNDKVLNVK